MIAPAEAAIFICSICGETILTNEIHVECHKNGMTNLRAHGECLQELTTVLGPHDAFTYMKENRRDV
jgi:hypothetical protein